MSSVINTLTLGSLYMGDNFSYTFFGRDRVWQPCIISLRHAFKNEFTVCVCVQMFCADSQLRCTSCVTTSHKRVTTSCVRDNYASSPCVTISGNKIHRTVMVPYNYNEQVHSDIIQHIQWALSTVYPESIRRKKIDADRVGSKQNRCWGFKIIFWVHKVK